MEFCRVSTGVAEARIHPEGDAQGTGEAENPRLNKQLEMVRFNQQRGLDFPPFSSIAASILVSTGQMRFRDL